MFKAAIFDLDGVITDTAEFHYDAWKKLASQLGIDFSREFNEELKGVSRVDSLKKILALGKLENKVSTSEFELLMKEKNDNYLVMLEKLTPDDILPGIVDFLEVLQEKGMKIGLASASKNAPYILSKLGLSDFFETIADPNSILAGKPAPDIFLLAASNLNVLPEECIGFEDAYSGVEAIHAAKMKSVAIGDSNVFDELEPDLIISTTALLDFDIVNNL